MSEKIGVAIVAYTMPDWAKFIPCFQIVTGESPTRELDKRSIPVGDPGSYAMALEYIANRPQAVGNLQKAYRSLDFIDFTFLINFDDGDLLENFCNLLDVVHMQHMDGHRGYVVFKGTVKQIKDLITVGCDIDQYRIVFNRMHDLLMPYGFKSLFNMKKTRSDGSFSF